VSAEEKTEQATPQKKKKSRKEGQVARSQEIGPWAAVLVVAMMLNYLTGKGVDSVQALLTRSLAMTRQPSVESALMLLAEGGRLVLVLSLALGILVLVVSILGAVAQGGLYFATKTLKPKWSRLSPLQGAKRLFGPHALWEGAKMLVKSALVTFFVWRAVKSLMPLLGGLVPVPVALELAAHAATGLMRDIAFAALLAGGVDYAVQRRRTGKQVRMTKKEVKDEHKQSEGDPMLKGQIRSRQLAAARSRMMSAVPEADVVLVNPTHVAVALKWSRARGSAPVCVAKGEDELALKIREIAATAGVPLHEDPPTARALNAAVEIGREIAPEHYRAVAAAIRFADRMRHAARARGRG
jgi:flagellar biosynthetic protein FlhB